MQDMSHAIILNFQVALTSVPTIMGECTFGRCHPSVDIPSNNNNRIGGDFQRWEDASSMNRRRPVSKFFKSIALEQKQSAVKLLGRNTLYDE